MKEEKLYRVKNIVLLGFLFFVFSCKKQNEGKLHESFSKKNVNHNQYIQIHKFVNDSIKNWYSHKLFGYREKEKFESKIDSLYCFNKEGDRFVSAELSRDIGNQGATMDYIHLFYGAKFNNKWYFFGGANYILSRDYYDSNIDTPLSFEKLHEIALEEIYSGYLIKKDKGFWGNLFEKPEYKINENFFKDMESRSTDGRFGSCFSCKTFNEYVIYITNYKWKKPDKDGYIKYDHPTKEEMVR